MVFLHLAVRIPFTFGTVIQLHEPHAALHQSPRHQAVAAKGLSVLVAQAVKFFCGLGFLAQVYCLGRGGLHAESQFVGTDAGLEFGLVFARLKVLFVEVA